MRYFPSLNFYIGKQEIFDEEEMAEADRLEEEWRAERVPTFHELVEIFPEAKGVVLKKIREKISTHQKELQSLLDVQRSHQNSITDDPKNAELYKHWIKEIEEDKINIRRKIKKLVFSSERIAAPLEKEWIKRGITDADIAQAKEAPIENFYSGTLRKYGKRMSGKCELHKDNTASFVIYTDQNSFFCYGCNVGGDSISYIQKLQNLNFIEAVKFILKI